MDRATSHCSSDRDQQVLNTRRFNCRIALPVTRADGGGGPPKIRLIIRVDCTQPICPPRRPASQEARAFRWRSPMAPTTIPSPQGTAASLLPMATPSTAGSQSTPQAGVAPWKLEPSGPCGFAAEPSRPLPQRGLSGWEEHNSWKQLSSVNQILPGKELR